MADEKSQQDEKRARQEAALEGFNKEFNGGGTPKDLGNMMHAYAYLKNIDYYIAKMRSVLFPPELLGPTHMPEREISLAERDLCDMGVRECRMNAQGLENNSYHAKVMTMKETEQFFSLKDDLDLPNLPKTVIPYEKARAIVAKMPERIVLLDCACRTARGDEGCWPRDVCMVFGEPWASFALEYNTSGHPREITQEEALKIIHEEHERGHFQAAFMKDACGDRLYGFCNCCACCCVATAAMKYGGAPLYANSGYVRVVDQDKCISCGTCVTKCHFGVPQIADGKMVWDPTKCLGCSLCMDTCPQHAISMTLNDPEVSQPLDLDVLIPKYGKKAGAEAEA